MFAVAVLKNGDVVGHIRRKISSICSTFLLNRTITCRVIGSSRYSADLPQGGLEVPYVLIFPGNVKRMDKSRRLLQFAMTSNNDDTNPCKKRKVEDLTDENNSVPEINLETVWVKRGGITLFTTQKTKV